jgi:hypothetical protein
MRLKMVWSRKGGGSWGEVVRCFEQSGIRASETNDAEWSAAGAWNWLQKSSMGFYSFFNIIPPSASTFRVAVSLSNLLMWRPRFFAIFCFPWLGRNFQGRSLSECLS